MTEKFLILNEIILSFVLVNKRGWKNRTGNSVQDFNACKVQSGHKTWLGKMIHWDALMAVYFVLS